QSQSIRVLAEKPQSDQQTRYGPIPRKARTFFHGEPEGKHRRHPEKNRQRINRYQDCPDIENRRGVQTNDRPKTCRRTKQTARKIKQQQTCPCGQHRTEEAHAKLICPKEGSASAYGESDPGSLAEVGGSQSL